MKLCQKCELEMTKYREPSGFIEGTEFMVSTSDCEFWAHKTLLKVAQRFAEEEGALNEEDFVSRIIKEKLE